jgi:hypothetical protein
MKVTVPVRFKAEKVGSYCTGETIGVCDKLNADMALGLAERQRLQEEIRRLFSAPIPGTFNAAKFETDCIALTSALRIWFGQQMEIPGRKDSLREMSERDLQGAKSAIIDKIEQRQGEIQKALKKLGLGSGIKLQDESIGEDKADLARIVMEHQNFKRDEPNDSQYLFWLSSTFRDWVMKQFPSLEAVDIE